LSPTRTLAKPFDRLSLARAYADFLDILIADPLDAGHAASVEALGVRLHLANVMMKSAADKALLGKASLEVTRNVTQRTSAVAPRA